MSKAGETRLQMPSRSNRDGGQAFFTAVGCMDGRVQEPVLAFGQQKFGAKYADTITEAGLVGLLAKKNIDRALLDSIRKKIAENGYKRVIADHTYEIRMKQLLNIISGN